MIHTTRLRLMADYLAATRNEIAVDEMLLGMAHVTAAHVGYLPRVPHWLNRAVRVPALTRAIWRLGRVLWLSGGAIAYFALDFIKLVRLRRTTASTPTKVISLKDGAVLGFSTRVSDVVDPDRIPWLPKIWLTCPWTPQHSLPHGVDELPLMALVNNADLREAFAAAICATYALARDPSQSGWALQSYTALRWFLVRRVVDRITGTLVMVNHFDRWAVLVDRSMRAGRSQGDGNSHLVLMQHGTLGGLGDASHGNDTLKPLPTRLSRVDELHVYNAVEESVFRRAVLTETTGRVPLRVHYFKPAIALSDECSDDRPRLLFVGHPLCETFQAALYRALRESVDICAFYKPHPKAPMSPAMVELEWTIIDNPKTFPRVDLLVSYPSTLVIEYQGVGILSSIHPLDMSIKCLPEFLDQTLRMVEERQRSLGAVNQSDKALL